MTRPPPRSTLTDTLFPSPTLFRSVEQVLSGKDSLGVRNPPYAGGFVPRHYGKPRARVHCLQIEINRHIYMDESRMERRPTLQALARDMRDVVAALGALDPAILEGRRQ